MVAVATPTQRCVLCQYFLLASFLTSALFPPCSPSEDHRMRQSNLSSFVRGIGQGYGLACLLFCALSVQQKGISSDSDPYGVHAMTTFEAASLSGLRVFLRVILNLYLIRNARHPRRLFVSLSCGQESHSEVCVVSVFPRALVQSNPYFCSLRFTPVANPSHLIFPNVLTMRAIE